MAGIYSKSPYMEGVSFKADSLADIAMMPMALQARDEKLQNQVDNYLMEFDKQNVGDNEIAIQYQNQKREEINNQINDVTNKLMTNGADPSVYNMVRSMKLNHNKEVGVNGGIGQFVELNKRKQAEEEKYRKIASMYQYNPELYEEHMKKGIADVYSNIDMSRVGSDDYRIPDINLQAPPVKRTIQNVIESSAGLIGQYGSAVATSEMTPEINQATGTFSLNYKNESLNTTSNIANLEALNNWILTKVNDPNSELMQSFAYMNPGLDPEDLKRKAAEELSLGILTMVQNNRSEASSNDVSIVNTQDNNSGGRSRGSNTDNSTKDDSPTGQLIESNGGLIPVLEMEDPIFLASIATGSHIDALERKEISIGKMKEGPERDKALADLRVSKNLAVSATYKMDKDIKNPNNKNIVDKVLTDNNTNRSNYETISKNVTVARKNFLNNSSNQNIYQNISDDKKYLNLREGSSFEETVMVNHPVAGWSVIPKSGRTNYDGQKPYSMTEGLNLMLKDKGVQYSEAQVKKYFEDKLVYETQVKKLGKLNGAIVKELYGKNSKADIAYKSTLLSPGGVESTKLNENLNKSLNGVQIMNAAALNEINVNVSDDGVSWEKLVDRDDKDSFKLVDGDAAIEFNGVLDKGNLPSELMFTITQGTTDNKVTKKLAIPLNSSLINHKNEFGGPILKLMEDLENGLTEPYRSRIGAIINNTRLDKLVLDSESYDTTGLSRGGTISLKASRDTTLVNNSNYEKVDPYKNIDKANIVASKNGDYKVNYIDKGSNQIKQLTFGQMIQKNMVGDLVKSTMIQSNMYIPNEAALYSNNLKPEAKDFFVKTMNNIAVNMTGNDPVIRTLNTQYNNGHQKFIDYIRQGGTGRTLQSDFTEALAFYNLIKNDGVSHKDITKLL